jgi:hypothetical protein
VPLNITAGSQVTHTKIVPHREHVGDQVAAHADRKKSSRLQSRVRSLPRAKSALENKSIQFGEAVGSWQLAIGGLAAVKTAPAKSTRSAFAEQVEFVVKKRKTQRSRRTQRILDTNESNL